MIPRDVYDVLWQQLKILIPALNLFIISYIAMRTSKMHRASKEAKEENKKRDSERLTILRSVHRLEARKTREEEQKNDS